MHIPSTHARQNHVTEWPVTAPGTSDADGANVDVCIDGPGNTAWRVPAFVTVDGVWRVRFSPPEPGEYTWRVEHGHVAERHGGQRGTLQVSASEGAAVLMQRGPLRVSADRRHLEHRDGTPFFWLADTWWLGLSKRLAWPGDFAELTAERMSKGFTVVQLVAGLYPELPTLDPRGANEGGQPWEPGFARLRPAFFDNMDLRIAHLIDKGIVPCILGSWGYHILETGLDKMRRHWRNLVARYSAYPVVWCLAGEALMPFYGAGNRRSLAAQQRDLWTKMAGYVRRIDPVGHPLTIHPTDSAREQVKTPSLLDIDLLQTGHADRYSIANTIKSITKAIARRPRMPVINSEVCYEGLMEMNREEVQRFMFWACMLSGAAGHTYGANGVWQMNSPEQPFGKLVHGRGYTETPWRESSQWPGGRQVGAAKQLLCRHQWWRFQPHPEWVDPHWTSRDYFRPYAAGTEGEVVMVYMPVPPDEMWAAGDSVTIRSLRPGGKYRATFVDPRECREELIGEVTADAKGSWRSPIARARQDWLLVLSRA